MRGAPRIRPLARALSLAGLVAMWVPSPTSAEATAGTASLEGGIYAEGIAPLLGRRCTSCHGPRKQKGELRLDSYAGILAGGANGPAAAPGAADDSLLMQRILLPLDDLDHMPPEEKTQLTDNEVRLLAWWLDAGLPNTEKISELDLPDGLIPGSTSSPPARAPVPVLAEIDWDALSGSTPLLILPVSQDDPGGVQVTTAGRAGQVGDEAVRALAPIAPRITYLNLSRTRITDSGLDAVTAMPNLQWLDLSQTGITDAGVHALAGLEQLRYLNLTGTRVTDLTTTALREFPALRQVYLGGTRVSERATLQLEERLNRGEEVSRLRRDLADAQARLDRALASVERGIAPASDDDAPGQVVANQRCPVSGEDVDPAIRTEHEGQWIAFCCTKCQKRFEDDPTQFPLPAT